MRIISTKVHGLIDYLMGIVLVISPFLLWTTENGADLWVPIITGTAMILYSVCTDYEWGAFRSISMRSHLNIDIVAGFILALSPWLFGFADVVYMPHLLIGLAEIIVSIMTKTEPTRKGKLGPSTL